ncbi:hypothetical protein [Winogradskyella sp. PE311]|uniref:hypothetical protein n=1 Tax=Winogradskyella sp. PE311 TaxID=3366943 RepID=UPI00397F40EC
MKLFLILYILLLYSCCPNKNVVYIESIPQNLINNDNRFDVNNSIYPVDKTFLYQCKIEHNNKLLNTELKYIKLIIQGTTKPFSNFDPDYSQTVIKFEYLDKSKKRILYERTGLVENAFNIWMHPPRQADLDVLQLSAFPYVKFNSFKKWKWVLDASYGRYQNLHLTHYYKKQEEKLYKTNLGKLKCTLIKAETKSSIKTTRSEFLFNQKFGFIKMKFFTIENTTITLELLK